MLYRCALRVVVVEKYAGNCVGVHILCCDNSCVGFMRSFLKFLFQKISRSRLLREGRKRMNNVFYWFQFEDGYQVCIRGFSRREIEREESKHGKLIRMVLA